MKDYGSDIGKSIFRHKDTSLSAYTKNSPQDEGKEDHTYGMADWKKRHAFLFKCISVLLITFFLHQQIGWAQDGQPVWAQAKPSGALRQRVDINGIKVPYDLAATSEAKNVGKDVIIHIQDAHASLSAQHSIVNLLDSLVTNYDLRMIAIEGATGYVDTSLLQTFPDKDIRKDTAEFLMREGRMGAGEFFTITNDGPEVSLYGIEDEELYQANVDSFRTVATERAFHVENINAFLEQLELMGEKISSDDLRILNRNCVLHREGRLSFTDHWKYLSELAEKEKIDFSEYTELSKLLKSIELERSIDFAKANLERRVLISRLSDEMDREELEGLVLKSLEFRQNKISQKTFHMYLIDLAEKHGIPSDGFGNLIMFTRYVSIYESVELFELYREIAELEDNVREKLFRNNDERELYRFSKMTRLLRQLYSMELTNEEFGYVSDNRSAFSPSGCASFVKEECLKYKVPITGGYDLARIYGTDVETAMKFYTEAEARNNAMLSNTIRRMRQDGKHVAALVTGGYHTSGLTELMRKKRLSYLVVIPKFEAGRERPYIAVLTNKKTTYEKILDSGRYQLAVEAYFQDKTNKLDTVLFSLFHALGETALTDKDTEAIMSIWQKSYEDRFLELKARGIDMEGKVTPDEFKDFLKRVRVEKIGQSAVISYRAEEGISFIALAQSDKYYEFNPTSKAQRQVFLGRITREAAETAEEIEAAKFREALEGLKTDVAEIKDMLSKFIGTREELLIQLSETSPDDIRARLKDPAAATDEEIIAKLRAKRLNIPRNWGTDNELAAELRSFIAKVREGRPSPITMTSARGKKVLYTTDVKVTREMDVDFGDIKNVGAKKGLEDDLQNIFTQALAQSEPTLAEIAQMKVQIEGARKNALDITTQGEKDDVMEFDIRLLRAVRDASKVKGARYSQEEYTRALTWMLNHEIRHAVLRTDNEAEEIAIIALDIRDFLLLDERTQGALLWLLSTRNKNGIDNDNFDALLRGARKKFDAKKAELDEGADLQREAGLIGLDMIGDVDGYLARFRPQGKSAIDEANEKGEGDDLAKDIAKLYGELKEAEEKARAKRRGKKVPAPALKKAPAKKKEAPVAKKPAEEEPEAELTAKEEAIRRIKAIDIRKRGAKRKMLEALGYDVDDLNTPSYIRYLATDKTVG
ncbi:hypothetical protein ACFL5E_00440, partial [Candidatus Omnitrophota bacterium]